MKEDGMTVLLYQPIEGESMIDVVESKRWLDFKENNIANNTSIETKYFKDKKGNTFREVEGRLKNMLIKAYHDGLNKEKFSKSDLLGIRDELKEISNVLWDISYKIDSAIDNMLENINKFVEENNKEKEEQNVQQ
jgi:hypothetical protein